MSVWFRQLLGSSSAGVIITAQAGWETGSWDQEGRGTLGGQPMVVDKGPGSTAGRVVLVCTTTKRIFHSTETLRGVNPR